MFDHVLKSLFSEFAFVEAFQVRLSSHVSPDFLLINRNAIFQFQKILTRILTILSKEKVPDFAWKLFQHFGLTIHQSLGNGTNLPDNIGVLQGICDAAFTILISLLADIEDNAARIASVTAFFEDLLTALSVASQLLNSSSEGSNAPQPAIQEGKEEDDTLFGNLFVLPEEEQVAAARKDTKTAVELFTLAATKLSSLIDQATPALLVSLQ